MLFIYGRFKEGLRCKQVIAPTLGVTLAFVRALFPAEFFNHSTASTARPAYRRKPEELRARRDAGAEGTVNLPLCGCIFHDIREHL